MTIDRPFDIVCAILAAKAPRTGLVRVKDLEDQLETILRPETRSIIRKTFPFHPLYGDCPRLSETLSLMRLAGTLETIGNDYDHLLPRTIRAYAARAQQEWLGEKDAAYLRDLGEKLVTHGTL